jgi:hypothetical protein
MRPGARWVWLSPMPARMAAVAHHLGFDVERRGLVDLGGLSPELQIFHVPELQKKTPAAAPRLPRPSRSQPAAKRRRIVR